MNANGGTPFFSVIVPIYKVEKYLEECLESICNQTFQDFELILVDDGSPDSCPQICDRYCKEDLRIRVIHKENGGLVEARKTGINAAKGHYTVFVDGDDWIDTGLLRESYNILQDKEVDIIAFDYYRNSPDYQEICRYKVASGYYTGEKKENEVCAKMMCTGIYYEFGLAPSIATKVFETELIREMLMQVDGRITMGEDAVVTYPAILKANTIVISQKAFYHYRDVQDSMSQKYNPQYFHQIEIVMDWFAKKNFKELEKQLILYKQMLLEEGILRILMQSEKFSEAIKEVKNICQQERYRELLSMIEPEILEPKKRRMMMALKEQNYGEIYRMYVPKRFKKKIKNIVRKLRK